MPRGDKSACTEKQKRQAEPIESKMSGGGRASASRPKGRQRTTR